MKIKGVAVSAACNLVKRNFLTYFDKADAFSQKLPCKEDLPRRFQLYALPF